MLFLDSPGECRCEPSAVNQVLQLLTIDIVGAAVKRSRAPATSTHREGE